MLSSHAIESFDVVRIMEKHFDELVDYTFSAGMDEDSDAIADGEQKVPYLKRFYFGNRKHKGLKKQMTEDIEGIDAAETNSSLIDKDDVGLIDSVLPDELTKRSVGRVGGSPSNSAVAPGQARQTQRPNGGPQRPRRRKLRRRPKRSLRKRRRLKGFGGWCRRQAPPSTPRDLPRANRRDC